MFEVSKEREAMGNRTAVEIADSGLSLEQGLEWHLQGNHYPPVPTTMVKPCVEAIKAFNEGDYQREIELPEKVLYRGRAYAPASAIVDAHHLDAFLDDTEEEF